MADYEKTGGTAGISIIMLGVALAMRQMSMSMVAPFISTYCKTLLGYTPLLAGLALGIFGLTQAIFQIPYGMLSDRFGNKPIMALGLLQTVAGLVVAFFAQNVGLLIFARALQGSGAVIGVGYAWTASIAGDSMRTKAMGTLSAFVSFGAAAAFILGPVLRGFMEVRQMFLLCASAIFLTVLYIFFFIRDISQARPDVELRGSGIKTFFQNRKLVGFGGMAFLNNYMMMSVFFAVPIYLNSILGESRLWEIFVPAIPVAFLAMKAAVSFTDKGFGNIILFLAFVLSSISVLFCLNKSSAVYLSVGMVLFLCGYIAIATILAADVNELADSQHRGTVNGIYNSMQFLGNFAGPTVTGLIWGTSQKAALLAVFGAGVVGVGMAVKLRADSKKENEGRGPAIHETKDS